MAKVLLAFALLTIALSITKPAAGQAASPLDGSNDTVPYLAQASGTVEIEFPPAALPRGASASPSPALGAPPPPAPPDCPGYNPVYEAALLAGKAVLDPTGEVLTDWHNRSSSLGGYKCYCNWKYLCCPQVGANNGDCNDYSVSGDGASSIAFSSIKADRPLGGELPAAWSVVTGLQAISVDSSGISGTLPAEWSTLTKLEEFTAGFNDLTGSLPHQWSTMTNLQEVYLNDNNFTGTLPLQWGNWVNVEYMFLTNNDLTGTLPLQWGNMNNITLLGVSQNHLTGTLPSQWSTWKNVTDVYFEYNNLTGTLPPQWGNWVNVKYMDLHSNNFIGPLPPEWGNMENISTIDVSRNNLSGAIPSQWNTLTNMNVMYLDGGSSIPHAWCSTADPGFTLEYIGSPPDFGSCPMEILCTLPLVKQVRTRIMFRDVNGRWSVGSGDNGDMCVDKNSIRIGTIVFSIFGAALMGVITHGAWKAFAGTTTAGHKACITPLLDKMHSYTTANKMVAVVSALFTLKHFGGTVLDIITDIILVRELLPFYSGWVMLGGVFGSDLLCSWVIYRHVSKSIASRGPSVAGALSDASTTTKFDGSNMLRMFNFLGQQYVVIQAVIALPMILVLSAQVHLLSAAMACLLIWRTFVGQATSEADWTYMHCLNIEKCFNMRSVIVAFTEAPISITFSALAYMVWDKRRVGKYLSQNLFLLSVVPSMVHILLVAWRLKEMLLETRSVTTTWKQLFDVDASGNTVEDPAEVNRNSRTDRHTDSSVVLMDVCATPASGGQEPLKDVQV